MAELSRPTQGTGVGALGLVPAVLTVGVQVAGEVVLVVPPLWRGAVPALGQLGQFLCLGVKGEPELEACNTTVSCHT